MPERHSLSWPQTTWRWQTNRQPKSKRRVAKFQNVEPWQARACKSKTPPRCGALPFARVYPRWGYVPSTRHAKGVRFGPAFPSNPLAARHHALLDHLVGECEQRRRHFQTQRFRGLEIDDQFVARGSLHWKVHRLLTVQ